MVHARRRRRHHRAKDERTQSRIPGGRCEEKGGVTESERDVDGGEGRLNSQPPTEKQRDRARILFPIGSFHSRILRLLDQFRAEENAEIQFDSLSLHWDRSEICICLPNDGDVILHVGFSQTVSDDNRVTSFRKATKIELAVTLIG